ncbi:succinyl-CoA:glutarate CoA-transferase-like [Amphiura filiformis]|uniref:succinyl-CoA:glutarate CoA-transferase-like n=1 Tax=Amphiura filiformis TaxID=82378 RepID=UPI003B21A711
MFHHGYLTRIGKLFTDVPVGQIAARQWLPQQPWIRTGRCRCSTSSQVHRPLEGIRILDLTRVLAGPFCAMLLGDLGAEVIKVERPDGGDDTRSWGPPFVADQSCYFLSVNRNKKSIGVNIRSPGGVQIIHDLAQKSDVVLENYIPGKLDQLGVGYKDLRKVAPSIIYCSITGYGSDGPYSKRGGYDVVGAALSGLLHITGPQDGEPCRVGVAMTDMTTGLYAHGAIMAALLHRYKTGEGQKIDCNLLSSQVSIMTHIAANYLISGWEARRWGTGHESIVPYQAFKTKDDKYLIVGAGNQNLFEILCKRIGAEQLLEDSRYQDNQSRVENRESLIAALSEIFSQKEMSVWLAKFEGYGLPYGPIQNMQQVFSDPQVLHNNMIQEFQHSTAGTVRVPGPAVKYSTIDTSHCTAPPRLSEHTQEVLQEMLGYSDDKIQQLHQDGAIGILKDGQNAG